jgi:hypothetical protein
MKIVMFENKIMLYDLKLNKQCLKTVYFVEPKTYQIMKFTRPFIVPAFAILVLISFSCGRSGENDTKLTGTHHYRGLLFSETPWDLERGTREISAEQAEDINNYRFTYDDEGRLMSVEYVRGDELLTYGSLGGAAKITYEYTDNKQIKRWFSKEGGQIEWSGVYTAEYTLGENGVRTGLKFFGKEGQPVENRNRIHSWVWEVLPDGMVRELRYNLAGEETVMNDNCPFYELRFTYDENGYVTRMANYMGDTLYNCTAENCGDIGVSYFLFVPGEHGELLSFSVFNVFGQMSNLYSGWSRRESKYDDNGYVLETAVFDQDNEYVGGRSVPVTQNSYDSHGALTETKNMDKDRNVINHPVSGVAVTQYKYDEKGNRSEIIRLDKDGNTVTM